MTEAMKFDVIPGPPARLIKRGSKVSAAKCFPLTSVMKRAAYFGSSKKRLRNVKITFLHYLVIFNVFLIFKLRFSVFHNYVLDRVEHLGVGPFA